MSYRCFCGHWTKILTAGALALLLAAQRPAAGQVVYETGFESRLFEPGVALAGLDGWVTLPFNSTSAKITDAASATGRKSVEVWGGDLESSKHFTFPPYEAVGSYRQPVNYAVLPNAPIVIVEADLLLETDKPATDDDFFTMTIAARSGDGETLGEMALSSAGSADVYGFDAAPGDPTVFSTQTELNEWHHLSLVMDFSAETTTVAYFLDGELIFVTPTTSTSKILLRGSMVVYARKDGGGDKRANYTARFDNFRISVHGTE
jgi:hypothetical protein